VQVLVPLTLTQRSTVQGLESSQPEMMDPQVPLGKQVGVRHPEVEVGIGHFGVTTQLVPAQEEIEHFSETGRTQAEVLTQSPDVGLQV